MILMNLSILRNTTNQLKLPKMTKSDTGTPLQCQQKVQKSGGPVLKDLDWLESLVDPQGI